MALNRRHAKLESHKYYIVACFIHLLLLTLLSGCAGTAQKPVVLAVVDGEPIDERDLQYALDIAHRREDLSSGGIMNIAGYVQKLIADRLIVQEAIRMGLDKSPGFQKAAEAYILRESVVRLHREEVEQKIAISEEDIAGHYREKYERFSIRGIELKTEEKAADILGKLKAGEDFSELAREHSLHGSGKDGGKIVLTAGSVRPEFREALLKLKPGETSDAIKAGGTYFIMHLIGKQEYPEGEFDKVRQSITNSIRKSREKERQDEYLKFLRERAKITIDHELLSSIAPDAGQEQLEQWRKDRRPVATVYDSVLTVEDFLQIVSGEGVKTRRDKRSHEALVNSWVDNKVVDHEALGRGYVNKPELQGEVYRYENNLLKNEFIRQVVRPKIDTSPEKLKAYYLSHQADYMKPTQYKFQHITVGTKEEADKIYGSLQAGGDFLWLAKTGLPEQADEKSINLGLLTIDKFPAAVREFIKTMKPGDFSPVFETHNQFRIVRLLTKEEETIEDFRNVRDAVALASYNTQMRDLVDDYVAGLKADAKIEIFDEVISNFWSQK